MEGQRLLKLDKTYPAHAPFIGSEYVESYVLIQVRGQGSTCQRIAISRLEELSTDNLFINGYVMEDQVVKNDRVKVFELSLE